MRNEDSRDELAQGEINADWLYRLEEAWQEVHAMEEDPDLLYRGYYEGLAEMVLRVANCHLDVIRERVAQQPGGSEIAQKIQSMKIEIKEA